jgi:phospholipase/carboxylesterase
LQFPIGPNASGYGWFPLSGGATADPAAISAAGDSLVAFVDAAQRRYPIAADKLALLGFSQGGVMAYLLALRQRQRFAALGALSTWLPPALVEPGADLAQLPVLVQHGSRDPLIAVARGQESVASLRQLGANVVYREYDMGHEINAKSLTDLATFLRDKVLSPIITL